MSLAASTIAARKLSHDEQIAWVEQVREVIAISPLVRPQTPNGLPMRVRVSAAGRLGWVGDASGYHYSDSDPHGRPWPHMPSEWTALADEVAGPHDWDSAIINWYGPDASLGWHRDVSERDRTLPIVTVSLGDACSWAVKLDERDKPSRCRLESGDVTLLAGETRLAWHTVERVIRAPMFSPLQVAGRISITLRVAG